MFETLLRGRLLTFHSAPQGEGDTDAYTYLEDAGLWLRDGKIAASGDWESVRRRAPELPATDHRPNLMMAGFIDTHIHFPQSQMIASWGAQLLDWLNCYVFPEEMRFADRAHADEIASEFLDLLITHGTTTAVAYCSVHAASVDAFFTAAAERNMAVIGGKVMMDRNAPEGLRDTPQSAYDDSATLIARWHKQGRAGYAISPRFAITSSPEQLEMAGTLVRTHPDCWVQTHLSENYDEIALATSLYPRAPDYLGIYEGYDLLAPRTLLGHCIHLSDRETAVLADTGAHPVFCPTSNLFLGSGCFDDARMRAAGVTSGVATDVGAGTSYSMLSTMNEAYKVLQLQSQNLHALRAFYWITRGNAEVLGLQNRLGTLDVGTDADVVVLDASATPAMKLRMSRSKTLSEELFALQMMGDDRAVSETYVAGVPRKAG